jgi:hypothetical protein
MRSSMVNFIKTSSKKIRILFILLIISIFILPEKSNSQIISMSILDLRTKIKNHKWSFHPGDSPLLTDKSINEYEVYDENGENNKNKLLYFAWASPVLKPEYQMGWIEDIQIQLAWTRYKNKKKIQPFKNFSYYIEDYKGYGWYRTKFEITKQDLKERFKSKKLVLRLGRIGQADAVYLNGIFIGGTGLKHNTPGYKILDDKDLFYDKIRFYDLPGELIHYDKPNVIAIRVFAKYYIAPGLSHGKFYIASSKKIERSKFWDDFKKIFVIVLTALLGIFYIYWHFIFKEKERASIYFALTSFAMALNTFMQSQVVYSMIENGFWIKKIEFMSFVIFVHLLLKFFVHFTKIRSKNIDRINRFWDTLGIIVAIAVLLMPNLIIARRFMFGWGYAQGLVIFYLFYIIIKSRKIPSMTSVSIGFLGMLLLLANDVLVGFQLVTWEFYLKDYSFAFFGMMSAASIVSNMIKSKEIIQKQNEEKERLSKFFSPDVIDEILDGELSLGGQERNITTLFADIVGFTTYSESHPPGKVLDRLNEMFTEMSEVIIKSVFPACPESFLKEGFRTSRKDCPLE